MEKEEIKEIVLRYLFVVPPIGAEHNFNFIRDFIMTVFSVEDENFNTDLMPVMDELVNEQCLTVREDQWIGRHGGRCSLSERQNIYVATDKGINEGKMVLSSHIIDALMHVEIKDVVLLNLLIKLVSPYDNININNEIKKITNPVLKVKLTDEWSHNRIMQLLKKEGFVKTKDGKEFKFNKRGKKLIEIQDIKKFQEWEAAQKKKDNERERTNDLLAETNLATGTITRRLYYVNVAIAVAGTVAAAYYTLEVVRIHYPRWLELSFVFLLLLIGGVLGYAVEAYIMPLIAKITNRKKNKDLP